MTVYIYNTTRPRQRSAPSTNDPNTIRVGDPVDWQTNRWIQPYDWRDLTKLTFKPLSCGQDIEATNVEWKKYEVANCVEFVFLVPGFKRSEIAIEVTEETLKVIGSSDCEFDFASSGFSFSAKNFGNFDEEAVCAELKKGVLHIILPMKPEKCTKIEIG